MKVLNRQEPAWQMNAKANGVDSVSENSNKSAEPSDGWASRVASSIYGTALELGSNRYVQAAVTVGVVAGGAALYVGRSKFGGAAEELLPSVSKLLPDVARDGVARLFAPAIIRSEVAQTPVLLLNGQRTITALSALGRSKEWASFDLARSFSSELVDESFAARPKLPPGVEYSLANLTQHAGADGTKWFTENARLREQAARLEKDSTAVAMRAPLLDKTMSQLSSSFGLPWKGVSQTSSERLADAAYALGKGDLQVAPPFLRTEFPALANVVTHEGTHLEQDHLIVSRMADQLLVGKTATPEQLQQLSGKYYEAFGEPLDVEHLQRILLSRDGHVLSAGASRRADELSDSIRTFTENNKAHYKVEQQAATFAQMRKGFVSGNATEVLNGAIKAAPGNYFYRQILDEPTFRGILAQLPRDSEGLIKPLDFRATHALDLHVFKVVDTRFRQSEASRQANLLVYKSWLHEREASSVGDYFESRLKLPGR